ncbi:hypothetical protein C7420_101834 [Pantoea ananatis]|uniref:hypothetical protein n=1 Tax=Pantoea ananas TaxID=553 RepID=UPI000DC568D2|nr:hypothetical protein [Pantoea ananatis]RAR75217.1 hypothetical protein C7420_101834 [Pantoea ananatis]
MGKYVTLISEFLAAAAIVASAITFVMDKLVWSKKVEVTASLVTSGMKSISLLLSNNGEVDVAIKDVKIIIPNNGINNLVVIDKGGELLSKKSSKLLKSAPSRLNSSIIVDYSNKKEVIPTGYVNCDINVNYIVAGDKNSHNIVLHQHCYAYTAIDLEALKENHNKGHS